jgi:UDP-N-acetylmuramoyl-tripeptide--D-alanyl-D-alanine ligase
MAGSVSFAEPRVARVQEKDVPAPPLRLTGQIVADAMGGRLTSGFGSQAIHGFSIDTRTLNHGDLFFALQGARFDGHDFLGEAFAKGAAGAVVSRPAGPRPDDPASAPLLIIVDDTTKALQRLGRFVRRESGARVVAITGSAGKTTTKEISAAILGTRYRVFRNKGNLNNHIGVPLSLLELAGRPDVAVIELGMNHAGEISTLVSIAEPEIRVWINVSEVHAEFFSSVEAIADAKAEILEGADRDAVLVANADDPLVMARAARFPGRTITFGTGTRADVFAERITDSGLEGVEALVRTKNEARVIRSPLPGRANLANLLAAIGVAREFGITLGEVAGAVRALRPVSRRGEVLRLKKGITVLDDSYNSNPAALKRAFETIAAERGAKRRVAVVGEMLELGARADVLHRECGQAAAGVVDVLITIGGPPAKGMAEAARASGLESAAVHHFVTSAEAARAVPELVEPGDLVLVKGSRGVRTELIVERLQVEFD